LRSKILLLSVLSLIVTSNLLAGGFQLNEHGAKALGMGGAFTAVANDASAIYWNGAGLSQLSGTNFVIGTSLIAPRSTFRGVAPDITENRGKNLIFFPTHLFASHQINEQLSVGFGFTTPFGLGTEWDEDWVGKYLAVETELRTFTASPIITYSPVESFSVSVGFVYSFADVLITRKSPITFGTGLPGFASDAFAHLEGDDMFAWGFNAGLMLKPFKGLTIGASYHSEVEYEFEGTANTTGPDQVASGLPNGDITAGLTTPQNIAVGIAVDITERFKISADYQFVGWSSYETLDVNFANEAYTDISSPRMYEDSYIIRFGTRFVMNDQVDLMAGVYFDNNPVSSEYLNPSLPEADRIGLSAGIHAQIFEKLAFEGSYLFIRGKQLTITDSKEVYTPGGATFNGTYNTYANIFTIGLVLSL